jgi:hypothetical protein
MPRRPPSCRSLTRNLAVSQSASCIWISDSQLSAAFDRFARSVQKRHGSNVPGPLEAQRRLAKRKMAGLTVHAPLPLDIGSLFGTKWLKESESKRQAPANATESPLNIEQHMVQSLDHYKAEVDSRVYRHEPGPLFQAVFGFMLQDKPRNQTAAKEALFGKQYEHFPPMSSSQIRDLVDADAPFSEILKCLRDPYKISIDEQKHLDFLEHTQSKELPFEKFTSYTGSLNQGLVLGIVNLSELGMILDRVECWLQKRWSLTQRQIALARLLDDVICGLQSCRVQTPDEHILHQLRILAEKVSDGVSMPHVLLRIYQACWPCPGFRNLTAPMEKQLVHWLDLVSLNNQTPKMEDPRYEFNCQHLTNAVEYLCRIHYRGNRTWSTNLDARFMEQSKPTIIQQVTRMVCSKTRPFSRNEPPVDYDEVQLEYDRQQYWFQAILNTNSFRKHMAFAPEVCITHVGGHQYTCPELWADVFNEITRWLPLDCALQHLPDLQPIQYCRLFYVFSFGPLKSGKRISVAKNLPYSIDTDLSRYRSMVCFEKACIDINVKDPVGKDFFVYAAFLSALKETTTSNDPIEETLLVPVQRLVRLLYRFHGEDSVFSFLTSSNFRQIIGIDQPNKQVEMLPRFAALLYDHRKYWNEQNDMVIRVWTLVKNLIIEAGPNWKRARSPRDFKWIQSEFDRNNFDRLLSHMALLAAKDPEITTRESFTVVHHFAMELQRFKLKFLNPMRRAITLSALIRPMASGKVVPYKRVQYVLHLLQVSGETEATVKTLDPLLIRWRNALLDTARYTNEMHKQVRLESQGKGRTYPPYALPSVPQSEETGLNENWAINADRWDIPDVLDEVQIVNMPKTVICDQKIPEGEIAGQFGAELLSSASEPSSANSIKNMNAADEREISYSSVYRLVETDSKVGRTPVVRKLRLSKLAFAAAMELKHIRKP